MVEVFHAQLRGEGVHDELQVVGGFGQHVVLVVQALGHLAEVDDVAVVHHGQPEGVAGGEGLGQVRVVGALGGVAHVPDAGVALQLLHVLGLEHVVDQPLPLVQVKRVVERGDAGRVLPPVLQGREADYHVADHVIGTVKTYYSAHELREL